MHVDVSLFEPKVSCTNIPWRIQNPNQRCKNLFLAAHKTDEPPDGCSSLAIPSSSVRPLVFALLPCVKSLSVLGYSKVICVDCSFAKVCLCENEWLYAQKVGKCKLRRIQCRSRDEWPRGLAAAGCPYVKESAETKKKKACPHVFPLALMTGGSDWPKLKECEEWRKQTPNPALWILIC